MSYNIGHSLKEATNSVVGWLPTLLTVAVILVIGWIVAVLLKNLTKKLLHLAGLDRHLSRNTIGEHVNEVLGGASVFVSRVIYLLVWLGTFSVAASRLHLQPVTDLVNAIYGYLPHVLAALLIFVLAALVSGFAKTVTRRVLNDTPTGRVVSTVVPVVVMSIAGFMILNELQFAPQIVNITYGALMGALALGLALSFGLGGQDVAKKMLNQAYENGQKHVAQAKQDVAKAKKKKPTTKKTVK